MSGLQPVVPLLITAAILLAGNGIQGTMLAMRAIAEGFSPTLVGLMGTAYFVGFLLGTVQATRLISAVGHVRVFASLAALAAATTLALAIFIDPTFWVLGRLALGFSIAGLFTVMESWLNASCANADRGRVLSVYRLVDLSAVTGSQLLIPVIGIAGFEIFCLTAILMCLSLVPIGLSRKADPERPNHVSFDLKSVWSISPLASIGIFAIGLTTSAFRMVGPVYGGEMGLDVAGIANFMAIGILGGALLQFPLGIISDRWSRRGALLLTTAGASAVGLAMSTVAPGDTGLLMVGIGAFGALALPLYSLSVAHANDYAKPGQYALLSAGLIFIYSLGACIGPLGASLAIEHFGPGALFTYIGAVHAMLVVVALARMAARPSVPSEERVRYTPLMRTSPGIFRLARGTLTSAGRDSTDQSSAAGAEAPESRGLGSKELGSTDRSEVSTPMARSAGQRPDTSRAHTATRPAGSTAASARRV